jgi:CubicO group peptidase (beta-lactamase class C family)
MSRGAFAGLLSVLLLLPGAASAAPPVPDQASVRALEDKVPGLMRQANVPGVSLALIRDGKLYWQESFGMKDAVTPVTSGTTFEAASLSKVVFTTIVLKLVDQGKLDLDTPLTRYVDAPHVQDIKNDPRLSAITARVVLSHRTGFPDWRPKGGALEIHFPPGDHFSYSGEGFIYLQRAVEKITGKPLEELARTMVFEPLGMKNSSYVWRSDFETSTAIPYDKNRLPQPKKKRDAMAAYSLQTTAHDYALFLAALLNGRGLRPKTIAAMETPQTRVARDCTVECFDKPAALAPDLAWGLGIGLEQTAQGKALWHWGDNGAFKAYFVVYPKQRSGLVMFANSENGLDIANDIVKLGLGSDQPALAWILHNPS